MFQVVGGCPVGSLEISSLSFFLHIGNDSVDSVTGHNDSRVFTTRPVIDLNEPVSAGIAILVILTDILLPVVKLLPDTLPEIIHFQREKVELSVPFTRLVVDIIAEPLQSGLHRNGYGSRGFIQSRLEKLLPVLQGMIEYRQPLWHEFFVRLGLRLPELLYGSLQVLRRL